ncbi:MAG: ABC transporter substrate-binding protein [Cyanobacteria bacterium M5B4]|nr:ABC transporter permease [Cyanobacteria bacterium KgW148]PLS69570.1 MAG: ABC transporter substrate-binding protein [Cyanobacteria bacterium M5B4]
MGTIAVAQRILLELVHRRRSLILWAVFPAFILLLNATILEERAQLSRAEAYQLATPITIVGAALFFSCLGGSIATVVAEREQKTIKRLFLSPLTGLSYFLGIFLAHSAIGIGQTLVILAIALFFGAEFTGSFFLSVIIIALSILSYVGTGFVLGTQIAKRTEDVNALIATFGVPLLLLGGSFVPANLFPQSLKDLAFWNPVFHINEALAGTMNDTPWEEVSYHFTFLVIFALVMVLGGWLSYNRMLNRERSL